MKRNKILSTKQRQLALKELQIVAGWLKKCNYKLGVFAKKYHFKKTWHGGMSDYFYKSARRKLIVKRPYLCSRPKKLSRFAIPTVVIYRPGNWDSWRAHILIQPLANTDNGWTAVKMLRKLGDRMLDQHSGNVAWYKGCPVRIDW